MERWDLVQSTSDREDSSWIEDVADETLGESDASERFLDQVLSPSDKARRDFRGGLRKLISQHQASITEISKQLDYLVPWPSGSAIHVGDIGSFSGTSFVNLGRMSALDIDMPPIDVLQEAMPTDLNYSSGDVSVVVTDPGVRIEFARAGGAFLQATGLSSHRISSLPRLDRQVQTAVQAGEWQEGWNVVTETVEAGQVLFFVAKEKGASVELIGGPRSLGVEPTDETPRVVRQKGMQITYVASQGAVVLFRTARVDKRGRLSLVRTFT